jgi:hypothetical protein
LQLVVNAEGNLPCFQPQCDQFPFSGGTASWQALPVTMKSDFGICTQHSHISENAGLQIF